MRVYYFRVCATCVLACLVLVLFMVLTGRLQQTRRVRSREEQGGRQEGHPAGDHGGGLHQRTLDRPHLQGNPRLDLIELTPIQFNSAQLNL